MSDDTVVPIFTGVDRLISEARARAAWYLRLIETQAPPQRSRLPGQVRDETLEPLAEDDAPDELADRRMKRFAADARTTTEPRESNRRE